MAKYKLRDKDIESRHNIARLERDGFKRQDVIDFMYKATPGCSTSERRELMSKVFDRSEK